EVGWLWPPLAAGSLAVELGAPLALLHRRVAHAWVAAAWCFHAGVLALMAIAFPYQLAVVAFAPLLPVERLRWLVPPRARPGGLGDARGELDGARADAAVGSGAAAASGGSA